MSISILELSTQVLYFYGQFPMGTRQSPAGSGRFGASFLQILVYKCALFQGRPVDNSFPGFICHHVFDPKLGEDRVLISDDGTSALLLWLHVDDLLLHGPTLSKVEEGLYFVLAEAQPTWAYLSTCQADASYPVPQILWLPLRYPWCAHFSHPRG